MSKVYESPVLILNEKFDRIDFADCYSINVPGKSYNSAREIAMAVGKLSPQWIKLLMDIRNTIVKPFGLKVVNDDNEKTHDWLTHAPITEETNELMVFGLQDSHLDFFACIRLEVFENEQQKISIETVVKFNNIVGKSYFFFVKPFHKVIIQSMLRKLSPSIKTDRT